MSKEELGFDPTTRTANGQRFIEVERNGSTERVVIDEVRKRAPCVAGRATTCWKAHCEGDAQMLLVVKDSWQYVERDEGEILRETSHNGVVNVARYYHHETVLVRGKDDDVRSNVRKGLDVRIATNYRQERAAESPSARRVTSSQKAAAAAAAAPQA